MLEKKHGKKLGCRYCLKAERKVKRLGDGPQPTTEIEKRTPVKAGQICLNTPGPHQVAMMLCTREKG